MKKDFNRIGATLCSSMRPRSSTTSWLNKFKLLALVLTTMLSVNVWGETAYTFTCPQNGGNTSYTTNTYQVTVDDITWVTPGNQGVSGGWRLGEKNSGTRSRYLYSKNAISEDISEILVVHGDFANMNSGSTIKLDVYSTAALAEAGGNGDVSSLTAQSLTASTNNTFEKPAGKSWANRFYRFTYSLALNGSSKKAAYITLTGITFNYSSGPTTYTLTYAAGGGSGTGPAQVSNLEAGDKVTLAANTFTAPSGKKFNGWNDGTSTYNAGIQYTMPSKNVTMTAQWTNITYTDYLTECSTTYSFNPIGVAAGSTGYGTVSPTQVTGIPENSEVTVNGNKFTVNGTTVTATPNDDNEGYTYAFSGWSNLPNTVTEDVDNIVANFTRTERVYSVTYNMNGGGWSGGTGAGNYTYGTGIATLANTVDKTGYSFAGWYDNVELEGSAVTSISPTATGDKQFWAKWNVGWCFMYNGDEYASHTMNSNLTYTIHLDGNTKYRFRFSDGVSHVYRLNGESTITSSNCTNWDFWRDNNDDCAIATTAPGDYTFSINDNNALTELVVSVTYPPSVLVTFDMNGHGANTTTYITPNTAVAQPSDPSVAGWDFAGWYTDMACTEGNEWNFATTISTNKTLFAKWTEARVTLYLDPGVWNADNAKFAVYYFGTAGIGWSDLMTIAPCESSIYTTTIPKGYEGVNFVRLSNDATYGTWDKKWNQTANITLSDSWDKCRITDWGSYQGADCPYSTSKYSPTTFTVTCAVAPAGYGTVSQASVTSVPCGTSISATSSTLRVGPTAVTATHANPDAQYTYAFDHWDWTDDVTEVTSNITATAHFTHTLNQYTINALELTNCAVAGGSSWPTGKKDYGSSFSTTFVANEGYKLPSEITVTGATYTWNAGTLTITSVIGDVTVSIVAVEQTYVNYRTTCCIRLGKVQVNNVTYLTTTSAQLNWNAQADATSYTLVLDGGTPIENITENHYSVTGLNPGTAHSFTVQAIGDGEYHCDGAVSNAKTFYTKINVTLTREGEATSTDLTSSDGIYSFPGDEADACTGWSFDGWSANSNVDGNSYTKVITPTHGSTYYAVYVNAGTYKTLPPCGPQIAAEMMNNNIVAVNGSWSAGLSEVALSAYNLTMGVEGGVTIKFESTNDNFKLKANTTSGAGQPADNLSFAVPVGDDAWNQNIVVTYNPTTAGATETATITVKVIRTNGIKEYASTQFTVKGYSLPAEFVMATKVDDDWYTMTEVAAASGNTPCPGTQLEVDNTTTPTIITGVADGYLPSITVFTPANRPTPNTNAECVRFESKKKPGNFLRVPDDNTYLYFSSENSVGNSYWRMTPNPSVEGEFYIALPNNAYERSLSAKDAAGGKTTFGHFKQTTSWRLLPLSNEVQLCTRYIAPNVQVTKIQDGSNDVTLKVSSTNGEPETLGYEYSTNHTSWTPMSGTGTSATVTLTGLTKGTGYTYYVRGIVTDGTENCSGEKEVTFSPFNPIVTVTPSSLELTCLAGETDTKGLTIEANADAAGWTIGANPITGANASMFSFNAGTSEVTFSPAVGTADGNYTATLTIKSQAGNASANVALMGTVVSKAAMVLKIPDMQNGLICEDDLDFDEKFYVQLNNNQAVYISDNKTSKVTASYQYSGACKIKDVSIDGAESQTDFGNYIVTEGLSEFAIGTSHLIAGHTYRITYYNDLANEGNGLYNADGLGFADGYVEFVYSQNCNKPTAMNACVTGPTSAVANWLFNDCDGNASVRLFTRGESTSVKNFTSFTSSDVAGLQYAGATNIAGTATPNWIVGIDGTGSSGYSLSSNRLLMADIENNKYYQLFSPKFSVLNASGTTSTVYNITVTMTQTNSAPNTTGVYFYVMSNGDGISKGVDPNPTNKTVTIDGQSASSKTIACGTTTFKVSGIAPTDRIYFRGFETTSLASKNYNVYMTALSIEASGAEEDVETKTPVCSDGHVAFTGLTSNTKYYYTVTNGGKTSNEINFTTYNGASSVQFYNNEACTSLYEITSSDNILVLGGEQTTVYLKGTKVAGCEPVVSVSAGYRIEDHSTYNPSTGALGGYVVLTLADPTQTAGTLTVTDGAGDTTVRNIISSTCPAGMNTMALPATNIEANLATANWNNSLTFDADDKSGKLYIFRDGSVDRELIENGGFETGDLTGWNYVNVGGLYACDAYNVVNSNGHGGSHSLHVTEEGSGYSGFAYSTVIYQNPMTLYPGTYVMTSWVKITAADCSGYSDKKAYFVQGLVGHQLQGSTNETCFAISSASTNRTRNNTYTTVTSNGTYVQLVDTFVLSKTIKALPIVGERCDYGYEFRKFYLDDVMMKRISAPISEDYDKLVEIANLSTASSVALTGLSGYTQYSYMIQDANGCSSNVITFKTLQSGEPSIEAEGIELSASQDKTATGVIVVTALDAYAPITITKCLDSKISLNTNTLPAEGGAIRVTFAPGATAAGTSGTCELSLSTTGMTNPVTVNVLWTVTAGEDVNTPKVDVTEVWTDQLTIEHNVGMDEVDSVYVQFNREKTEEEIVLNVGDEIFFSKYYEAYSHKKLWAIFNPRNDTISLAGMEVWRSKSDGTWNTDEVIDLSDAGFYEQGWIYPQEEIVVYTADQVGGCEQRHVDMSTWYAGAHADLALSFSGDDALLLVRNTDEESAVRHNQLRTTSAKDGDPISWPDAISERGEEWHILDIIGAHDGTYNPTSEACTNWDWYNSKTKVNESGDDKGWVGYGSDMDNKRDYNDGKGHEGYLLSTNRCLLVRNKSVTSGANALANNITNMITLNTEWQGSHVPTSTPGMTQDSVSCVNFSYVGGYNYAGYYNSWTELEGYEIAAEPNPDGSWTVEVEVPTYSCKMFHIEAVKMDTINGVVSPNVVTSVDYKVPIVVDKNKATTADLFDFGGDTCATCDVVVRDGAKLSHVTGGKSQFRELIVYPGAKFDNSSKQGFLLDRITVQSKNTEVGYAIINDDGSSIAAGEVRHVKRIDDQHWYSFSLPYDCKISSIQQQNGKSMGEYAEDWVIAYYDGARRQAERADGHIGESSQYWIDMPSDGVLEANKAYIIGLYTTEWPGQVKNVYFPPYVATGHDAYTEFGDDAKTANIYNWTEGIDNNPERNHGWNFVGSPYISMFNETTDGQGLNNGNVIMKGKMNESGEITEDLEHVYISVPADADMMTYNQVLASSQKILPFTGYFVQAIDPTSGSNETLELEYAKGNRTLDNPTLETPERRATATRQRVLVELNVIAPNGDKDNTGIWVDDRYTVDYEIGRDLMKMYGEAGRPQLYSRAADNLAMAYIALPDEQAEYVPLELYAPKAGAYILKIDENTSMTAGAQSIELLYNNEVVANLFFDAYEIAAAKAGTIRGYAVRIRRIAQVTTSNEQIGGQTVTIITNEGQMSVTNLPNDAVVSLYDVLGHRLAMSQAVDGVVNFEAPMTGVYNIVVESAVGQAAIKTVIK